MSIPPTIPTHGQQQLSFFNGGYGQHMYHPLLVFERHTGCLLAARLRRGNGCQSCPHRASAVTHRFRDSSMSFLGSGSSYVLTRALLMPLLYEFCEFFGIQYAIGIACQRDRLQRQRQRRRQRRLARRLSSHSASRSALFPVFRTALSAGLHQRRICYKAEHTETGTNLRFLVTNLKGRSCLDFSLL